MPMTTTHTDTVAPTITKSGSFTTVRWDRGLAIQLDAEEWQALVEAIDGARFVDVEQRHALVRDEENVRHEAEIREALQ